MNRKQLNFDWDNDELDQSENLVEDSVHVGMSVQISGIELKSKVKIAGSTVTILQETMDQEMQTVATEAGFNIMPAITAASTVDNIIVIENNSPDGAVIV